MSFFGQMLRWVETAQIAARAKYDGTAEAQVVRLFTVKTAVLHNLKCRYAWEIHFAT